MLSAKISRYAGFLNCGCRMYVMMIKLAPIIDNTEATVTTTRIATSCPASQPEDSEAKQRVEARSLFSRRS